MSGTGGQHAVASEVLAAYTQIVVPNADTATSGTLSVNEHNYVSATGGAVSRALPTGQPAGTTVLLEKSDAGTNTVSATGNIRGVASSTFTISLQHQCVQFVADSAGSWWPFTSHMTLGSLDARYAPIFTTTEETEVFSMPGVVTTGIAPGRWYIERPVTWVAIRASVNTAPTGHNMVIDILKNGTSIFNVTPANRPTIAISGNTALSGTPDTVTATTGDFFQVQVVSVGSTVVGSDLTVQPRFKATA